MKVTFSDEGWADYLYWQSEDRKILKRVNRLIEDIYRNGNEGIGKRQVGSAASPSTADPGDSPGRFPPG